MATDNDVLFVGVVGISKRREARGRLFASLSFSSSTEMLLRSTMFSKSLSCEMNSELSEEETAKQSGYQPKRGTDNFRCI